MSPRGRKDWGDLLRSLGRAFGDVVSAELEALKKDFARDGRHLGIAVGLIVAATALVCWSLGIVTALAIAVLAIWLPIWASILIVLVTVLLVVAILLLVARHHIGRLEGPTNTVQRRWTDHRRWWNDRVLAEPAPRPALDDTREAP